MKFAKIRIGRPVLNGRISRKMAINSIKELWDQICEDCRSKQKISEVGLDAWITDLVPASTDNGVLTLIANNEYKKKTVEGYYKKILEKSCEEVSGLPMSIEIVLETEKNPAAVTSTEEFFTFENFIVGPSNQIAHASAKAVASNPYANQYNPLFLYGNSGLGKTHLMLAIKNSISKNFPDKKIIYLSGEQFVNELIQAIRTQTTDLFHERFRTVDVLLIDDIHFIAGKEQAQEEFFNTFNALYPEKQIVVTSDRPPKEIKTLEDRIRSRMEMGMMADVQMPDFETRVGILKKKSEQIGLEIDDDFIYYIAEQIKGNIRQLEGMIKKINAYVLVHSQTLTIPVVQRYIRDIVTESTPEPVTVDMIVGEISRTYNVSVEDIYSKKKSSEIAHARQVSMYIVNQVMKLSSTEIGKKFNKDHTTVLYTVDKIKKELKNNESERRLVDDIIKNISQ